jgi:hypothetical protein
VLLNIQPEVQDVLCPLALQEKTAREKISALPPKSGW